MSVRNRESLRGQGGTGYDTSFFSEQGNKGWQARGWQARGWQENDRQKGGDHLRKDDGQH